MTSTQIVPSDNGFSEGQRTVRDYVCGVDRGELVLRFLNDEWVASCPRDESHQLLLSRSQLQADDVRERLERNPETARALAVQDSRVPLTSQAIRELDNDKLLARIPARYGSAIEVTKDQRLQLAQLARVYGLDPLWDLMIYEGRPYVTYDGRLRKLREHPDYRGHRVRPLTREEKDQWGYEPADLVIQCDVDMGLHGTITDWGIVRAAEVKAAVDKAQRDSKKPAPVASHPQQIAIKRSVSRASKQAAGIDLPTVIEASGRVIDIQEVRRPTLAAANPEDQVRRRFWSIARGSPPDGLGLDDEEVHRLLGVTTLTGYPGGWDQALSDLTERAAETDAADSLEESTDPDPGDMGEGGWGEAAADAAFQDILKRNAELLDTARDLGVRGLGPLKAAAAWPAEKIEQANAELNARIKSRDSELDAQASAESGEQARAF